MMENNSSKQKILNRLSNVLRGQAMFIRDDTTTTDKEKLQELDVVLNVMKFLNDYDENISVLTRHLQDKNQRERMYRDTDR